MKTFILIIITNCLIIFGALAADYVPGHLIIGIKKEIKNITVAKGGTVTGIESIDALNARYGCTGIQTILPAKRNRGGIYLLVFPKTVDVPALQKAYMTTGALRYAEPDYIATLGGTPLNDTLFYEQWSFNNDGSFTQAAAKAGADIDMLRAWDVEDGDTAVIMAVIDSGLKTDHPEFAGRLWKNTDEIAANGIDDDNNGYIDDTSGWNTVADTNYLADDNGHGTNVTSIIAANGNNIAGFSGIDHHCRLMICKAADATGFVDYAWMAEAIAYAVDNGANIINISAGGYWPSSAFSDVAAYAYDNDVTIVAAMGNNHTSIPCYPAACTHVIAVGATGPADKVAAFSNFGTHISVVAPGEYIYGPSYLYDSVYTLAYNGTSQATPHVAGVAALLLAQDKTRKPDDIRTLIETNAEDMVGDNEDVPGWDKYYGYGRLNAYRALVNEILQVNDRSATKSNRNIYPNPATNVIYIQLPEPVSASITNAAGATLWHGTLQPGTQKINLPPLQNGMYLLHCSGSNGTASTERFAVIK